MVGNATAENLNSLFAWDLFWHNAICKICRSIQFAQQKYMTHLAKCGFYNPSGFNQQ